MSSIIIFIIVLVVLVLFHEFGHFLIAKLAGIRVDEFSVGFPPRIFKKKIGETTYSFGATLLGGFVKIFGESEDDVATDEAARSRSFISKPKWVQAAVVSAGIIFNVLLAWILLTVGYVVGMPSALDSIPAGATVTNQKLIILDALAGSPAKEAGLASGDIVEKISAGSVSLVAPDSKELSDFIDAHSGGEVILDYKRGATEGQAHMVPVTGFVEGRSAVGVSLVMTGVAKLPIHRAIVEGASLTVEFVKQTFSGLVTFFGTIFTGTANFSDVRGPIGIVGVISTESSLGFIYLLVTTALISINLAIINLIPLPALDGGRLFFIILEGITGRALSQSRGVIVAQMVSFALLILLLVVVSYHDIARIVAG